MICCKKCGKKIPDDSLFCPFCGQSIDDTTIEQNNGQFSSPQNEAKQKYSSSMTKGKLVFLVLSSLLLVLLVSFAVFQRSIMFAAFDPDSVILNSGEKVISYNLDTKKYTKDYLSKVQIASSPKSCRYIVKFRKSMETRDNYYTTSQFSNISIDMDAHQEIIYAEIYDVRTGKTIEEKTFSAFLPWETTSTYFYVDEGKVENWVKETIENN